MNTTSASKDLHTSKQHLIIIHKPTALLSILLIFQMTLQFILQIHRPACSICNLEWRGECFALLVGDWHNEIEGNPLQSDKTLFKWSSWLSLKTKLSLKSVFLILLCLQIFLNEKIKNAWGKTCSFYVERNLLIHLNTPGRLIPLDDLSDVVGRNSYLLFRVLKCYKRKEI